MEIKIISQTIDKPKELLNVMSNFASSEVSYKIKKKEEGTRTSLESVFAIVIGSKGISTIIVAVINAIKDYKIQKLKTQSNEKEKEKDRQLEREKMEAQKAIEKIKLEEERKRIVLNGYVKIKGNCIDSLLKETEGREEKIAILKKVGFEFDEDTIKIPTDIKWNENISSTLDDIVDMKVITKIAQFEQD